MILSEIISTMFIKLKPAFSATVNDFNFFRQILVRSTKQLLHVLIFVTKKQ